MSIYHYICVYMFILSFLSVYTCKNNVEPEGHIIFYANTRIWTNKLNDIKSQKKSFFFINKCY